MIDWTLHTVCVWCKNVKKWCTMPWNSIGYGRQWYISSRTPSDIRWAALPTQPFSIKLSNISHFTNVAPIKDTVLKSITVFAYEASAAADTHRGSHCGPCSWLPPDHQVTMSGCLPIPECAAWIMDEVHVWRVIWKTKLSCTHLKW